MTTQIDLNDTFTLPGTSMTVNRMGYGAMQLAGPQVWVTALTSKVQSLSCERRSSLVWITSTPATFTVRM